MIICVLAMAVVSGIVLNYLKIPTIIGYILTGTLTTYLFGFHVEDSADLSEIAEIGIVFLMFSIGLEFSFQKITQMRQEVLLFGGLQIGLSIAAFFAVCYFLLRFNFNTSIIVASAVSLSSTAIVLKQINEINQSKTPYGTACVGILVFQDIAVIPILLLIKLLSNTNLSPIEMLLNTGISAIVVVLLLIIPGRFVARIALRSSAKMKTDEIFVGSVFLIILGSAYLSKYFGFSLSLGAFLAGMIISNSPFKYQVASVLVYFRDILLGVFFITIGMQVDVLFTAKYFIIVLLLCVLMILTKTLIIFAFLAFFRGVKNAMRVALSLSQIGEFSFAVFLLASQHKILDLKLDGGILSWIFGQEFLASITSQEIYQFLTLMVIFSMIATPFILEHLETCIEFILRILRIPTRKNLTNTQDKVIDEVKNDVIVCGYGALGKKVVQFLDSYDVTMLVVDSNYDRVKSGLQDGVNMLYGNVSDKMIFREIALEDSSVVVLCMESGHSIMEAYHHIKDIAHNAKIIALVEDDTLNDICLYGIVNGTQEIATQLGNLTLEALKEQKEVAED
ncbi:cation:proton antiporter [Helicobacter sp.]|uniref:cation:proton antiporter domain-containing protein n=2 Tax=Helicobacter sp. TaxID=218 RepID=UPI0025BDCD02|nr:cation:proton antiporter [Helicobacter sp.]MDY5557819.1 cation:proton antiporter [Helicobacter sp.]